MRTINEAVSTQSLLAMLVTNARYALKLAEDPVKFCRKYKFNEAITIELADFMKTYGQQFMKSALLLKKKRFDSILEALPILMKIYGEECIENMWERYLTTLSLNDIVPKNPLSESIIFCTYILEFEKTTSIEKNLVKYEISRNQSILDHGLENKKYKRQAVELDFDTQTDFFSHKPIIHPSFKLVTFKINISSLVQSVLNGKNTADLESIAVQSNETILFSKNWIKGGILSIKLTNDLHEIIKILSTALSTADFIRKVKNRFNQSDSDILKLLVTLKNTGVITFSSIICLENNHAK